MKNTIIQYIHRPNNTELGKGNTHDCYLLITSKSEAQEIINTGSDTVFTDLNNDKTWTFKATTGREFRITKMSDFYYENDVEYGDEIILQKHIVKGVTNRYVSIKKMNAIGLIRFKSEKYEISNIEKCPELQGDIELDVIYNGNNKRLRIEYIGLTSKKITSPDQTETYKIYLDGNILNKTILLFIDETGNKIIDYNKYEYHKLTWEE